MEETKETKLPKLPAKLSIAIDNGFASIVCDDPCAKIRYTTKGQTPKWSFGFDYVSPIKIDVTFQKIRARAFREGFEPSSVCEIATRSTRMLRIDVCVKEPDDDKDLSKNKKSTEEVDGGDAEKKNKTYLSVINSINIFRHAAASCAAMMYIAESSMTRWNEGESRVDVSKHADTLSMLKDMQGSDRSKPLETHIQKIAPTWMSHLRQECVSAVESAFSSKDPKIPNCSRRILIHGSSRSVPEFKNVGLPILYCSTATSSIKWDGLHRVQIKWDSEIGPVTFKVIGKRKKSKDESGEKSKSSPGRGLDPHRAAILRKIVSGEYQQGTTHIMEDDGRLFLLIPYSFLPTCKSLDEGRVMEVEFTSDPENFIRARVDEVSENQSHVDIVWSEILSASGAIDQVRRIKTVDSRLESTVKSMGSRTERKSGAGHARGHVAVSERRQRLSKLRSNAVRTWNHVWSSRIISWAKRRNCGLISLRSVPSDMLGWPWQIADLITKLKYKSSGEGIVLNVTKASDEISVSDIKEEAGSVR